LIQIIASFLFFNISQDERRGRRDCVVYTCWSTIPADSVRVRSGR